MEDSHCTRLNPLRALYVFAHESAVAPQSSGAPVGIHVQSKNRGTLFLTSKTRGLQREYPHPTKLQMGLEEGLGSLIADTYLCQVTPPGSSTLCAPGV
jgi:hypothetical protein